MSAYECSFHYFTHTNPQRLKKTLIPPLAAGPYVQPPSLAPPLISLFPPPLLSSLLQTPTLTSPPPNPVPSNPHPLHHLHIRANPRPPRRLTTRRLHILQSLALYRKFEGHSHSFRLGHIEGRQSSGVPDRYEELCGSQPRIREALWGKRSAEAGEELCGCEAVAEGGGGGD